MSLYGLLNTTFREMNITYAPHGEWNVELCLFDVPGDGYTIVGEGHSPDAALQDCKRKFDAEKEDILRRIAAYFKGDSDKELYEGLYEFLGDNDETEKWYQKLK